MEYDVIIVGGGSAGLTAAIYTCRKELSTIIISQDIGGQAILTNHIENYPGVDIIGGPELMSKFQKQAIKFGAEFTTGEVSKIKKVGKFFEIEESNGKKFKSKTVIVSSG
jgi:thioredoxin reductase